MSTETPEDMLERLYRAPEPEPGLRFRAAVWQRLDEPRAAGRCWLEILVPALGWRVMPACLALVVGSVASAMLVREQTSDALDVFDPESAYSIVAVVGLGAGTR